MIQFRPLRFAVALVALCLSWSPVALAQGTIDELPPPVGDNSKIFPYELVNYTQLAHETRIQNASVVVLGKIESFDPIEATNKARNHSVWLRVESFLRTDRPGQKDSDRIFFRTHPLLPPYAEMKPGDRCVLLLDRDQDYDNALILPTDLHYYAVSTEGQVQKFWKDGPTADAPTEREQALSAFLEEIRRSLRAVDLEQQVRDCDLVLTGTVSDSRQGSEERNDFFYVQVKPEKIYKGETEKEIVTFIQRGNPYRWAVPAQNRAGFKVGDRVMICGNKDPTFSKPGPWNPKGEEMWVFPYQKNSTLFLARTTAWRRGVRPIPLEKLYADLERWTKN